MNRRVVVLSLAFVASACRDVSLPPPPGPGTISGRVVVAIPGVGSRQLVAGAEVQLVSSSVTTVTDSQGRFVISGLSSSQGTLRFRAEVQDLGLRQKSLTLESIGAGPGRDVQLGDVTIVESATVRGRGLRGDLVTSPTGHLNSLVFVPEGPFTTYTADDGSFVLDELPDGPMQLSVFRNGYRPAGVTLTARSGELTSIRELVLEPLDGPELPGKLRGQLRFSPEQPDVGDALVRALRVGGGEGSAEISSDATFVFAALAPGLYDLVASRSGFATAVMRNVLVTSSGDASLGDIVLQAGTSGPVDAGVRPEPPDASIILDAGTDAGTDAGSEDAGSEDAGPDDAGIDDAGLDAGPLPCVGPANCANTEWCDDGVCRPQCGMSADCTNARICDVPTGTCVRPCAAGCATGETCHPDSDTCRRLCDISVPCPSGQTCNADSICEPECIITADCNSAYRVCQAGACVSNGACLRDRDCPSSLAFCIGSLCAAQPRVVVDGGFACTVPCDCREGEVCESSGVCVSDPLPTLYFSATGTGSGTTPDAPTTSFAALLNSAPAGSTLALSADQTFAAPSGQNIPADRITVAGGYVSCGSARWVRDITKYSTVRAPTAPVFTFAGTVLAPRADVKIFNLDVRTDNPPAACNRTNIEAGNTLRLTVKRLRSRADGSGCSGNYGMFVCSTCAQLDLDGAEQLAEPNLSIQYTLLPVQIANSSGRVRGVSSPPMAQGSQLPIIISGLSGPLTIERAKLSASTVDYAYVGITASNCGTHPLTIQNNELSFAIGPGPSINGYGSALSVSNCSDVRVLDNVIDGSQQVGVSTANGRGFSFTDSGGVVARNRFLFPTFTQTAASTGWAGMHFQGAARFDVTDNQMSGGTFSIPSINGVRLMSIANLTQGPLRILRNQLSAGVVSGMQNAFTENSGIWTTGVPGTVGLEIRDNVITAPTGSAFAGVGSTNICNASYGMHFNSTTAIVERNRVSAPAGHRTNGVRIQNASSIELVGNGVFAGIDRAPSSGSCAGFSTPINAASALHAEGASSQVYALGNTFEGVGDPGQTTPSVGVTCSSNVVGVMKSNVINGGRATEHYMVFEEGGSSTFCDSPAAWTNNYFFYLHPGARFPSDQVDLIVLPDAGTGNVVGDRVSCVDPGGARPHLLLQGGPCINRGDVGQRRDNSVPTIDLDGQPRVQGARADMGCCEKE